MEVIIGKSARKKHSLHLCSHFGRHCDVILPTRLMFKFWTLSFQSDWAEIWYVGQSLHASSNFNLKIRDQVTRKQKAYLIILLVF